MDKATWLKQYAHLNPFYDKWEGKIPRPEAPEGYFWKHQVGSSCSYYILKENPPQKKSSCGCHK